MITPSCRFIFRMVALAFLSYSSSLSEIRVYFNRSIDSSYAIPGNVALGNVDLRAKLVARIDSATYSIDLALYSIDIDSIAHHIVAAKNRGVRIRVVYENRTDQSPITTMRNNGIQVMKRKDNNGLMHNKFFVFDARDSANSAPWVWAGSWNVTQAQQNTDYNNAIEIQNRSLALAYTKEFEEMWGSSTDNRDSVNAKFGSQKTDNTQHLFVIDGKAVECYFSPSDGTTSKIINKINSVSSSINFALFSFTRQDVVTSMKLRSQAGASVRGIMKNIDVQATWDSLMTFAYMWRHTSSGLFHHKYAILDADTINSCIISGSHNWSSNAENSNDENILIIYDAPIANQYLQEFEKRRAELSSLISGKVFDDLNGSGTWESGEPGLANWTVTLNGPVSSSKLTDANGDYSFDSLPFGLYAVSQIQQGGWIQTMPPSPGYYSMSISAPGVFAAKHFGNEIPSNNITTVTSGNWSTPSTWTNGTIPGESNSVVIGSSHTVTIDGPVACGSLTVVGTLQFDEVSGRSLTLGSLGIASGGTVRPSAPLVSGTTTQALSISGNFANHGVFSASVSSSGTRVINVIFNGSSPSTISGSTNPTTFNSLTMNMSSSAISLSPVIDLNFTGGVGSLMLVRGTWDQGTARTATPNVNDTVRANAVLLLSADGSFSTGTASLFILGTLNMNGGTLTVGNGNNSMQVLAGGTANFTGGTALINGRLTLASGSTTISGTEIRVNPRGTQNLGGTSNAFEAAGPASLTMNDGSITIVNPKLITSSTGREIRITAGGGAKSFAGGTIYFGDGISTLAGSDTGFVVESPVALPNIIVQTGDVAGRTVTLASALTVASLALESGILRLSGVYPNGYDLTVKGPVSRSSGALLSGQRTVSILAPPEGGSGSISGVFTSSNAFSHLTVSNPAGMTLNGDIEVTGALTVVAGTITSGQSTIILGSTATLSEPPGKPIVGAIRTMRDVPQNVATTFGGIGFEITPMGAPAGQTVLTRRTGIPFTSGGNMILRSFDVAPTNNSNLDAMVTFKYDPAELSGNTSHLLRLWRSSDSGVTWQVVGGSVDTAAKKIEASGVQQLSVWTAADTLHFAPGPLTRQYTVQQGWNLLSLPLMVGDPRKSILFPTASSPAFKFSPTSGYTQADTLHVGVGYWLKFDSTQQVSLVGYAMDTDTISVFLGWNLVGSISTPVAVSTLETIPSGIIASNFYRYLSGYSTADTLHPGKAYWVKTSSQGRIVLRSTP